MGLPTKDGRTSKSQQHMRNEEDREKTVRTRRAALTKPALQLTDQRNHTQRGGGKGFGEEGDIGLRSASITKKRKELCVSNTTVFK